MRHTTGAILMCLTLPLGVFAQPLAEPPPLPRGVLQPTGRPVDAATARQVIPTVAPAGPNRPIATSETPPAALVLPASASEPVAVPVPMAVTAAVAPVQVRPTLGVSVEAVGPESAGVGQPLAYDIIVRNPSPAALFQVRVEEELPTGTRYLGGEPAAEVVGDRLQWNLGTLDAGAERRVRVEARPTAEGEFKTRTVVTSSAAAGFRTAVRRPKLTVGVTAPKTATVGEPVPFTITLTNSGSGPAGKIRLRAALAEGLAHPQGRVIEADMAPIPPGETKTVTLRSTADRPGPTRCELAVTVDGGAEATARAEVVVSEPSLGVRQTVPNKALVNQEFLAILEVTNPGTTATPPVTVVTRLTEGVRFLSSLDAASHDEAARTVSWTLNPLPPGTSRTVSFKAKAATAGVWAVGTTASAGPRLEARAESPLKVEGIPALALEVVDLEGVVSVNREAVYEIRVVNQGTCPCTNVQLAALLGDGMAAASAAGPVGHKVIDRRVQFEALPRLGTRADAVYRVRVRCPKPGEARLRVTLSCAEIAEPLSREEGTRFYQE